MIRPLANSAHRRANESRQALAPMQTMYAHIAGEFRELTLPTEG